MTVIDTDLLVALLRRDKHAGLVVSALVEPKTSAVTRFELYRGVAGRSDERKQVEGINRLLNRMEVIPLDERTSLHSARLYGELRGLGLDIGLADSIIAGTALGLRETLLSRNEKHFSRVPGLKWRPW